MIVTVPLTIEVPGDELEFSVRVDVGRLSAMYSDERGDFGPLCRSVEVLSASRDGTDATDYVRDYLDANKPARAAIEDDACQEAEDTDNFLREEAAERRAESRREERW